MVFRNFFLTLILLSSFFIAFSSMNQGPEVFSYRINFSDNVLEASLSSSQNNQVLVSNYFKDDNCNSYFVLSDGNILRIRGNYGKNLPQNSNSHGYYIFDDSGALFNDQTKILYSYDQSQNDDVEELIYSKYFLKFNGITIIDNNENTLKTYEDEDGIFIKSYFEDFEFDENYFEDYDELNFSFSGLNYDFDQKYGECDSSFKFYNRFSLSKNDFSGIKVFVRNKFKDEKNNFEDEEVYYKLFEDNNNYNLGLFSGWNYSILLKTEKPIVNVFNCGDSFEIKNSNVLVCNGDYNSFENIEIEFDSSDSDGDGITDSLDQCPSISGPVKFIGCPSIGYLVQRGRIYFNDVQGPESLSYFSSTNYENLFSSYYWYFIDYPENKFFGKYRDFRIRKVLTDEDYKLVLVDYNQNNLLRDTLIEADGDFYFRDKQSNIFKKLNVNFNDELTFDYNNVNKNLSRLDFINAISKLKDVESVVEAENLLNSIYNSQKNVLIKKDSDIIFDNGEVKTNITISIDSGEKDLIAYYFIPKSVVENVSMVNVSGVDYFVSDKDPIIGWQISGQTSANLVVDSSSDSGTVIVSEVPVVYNNGDLIVNYRKNPCRSDEVELFKLDNLSGSRVLDFGGFYNVCVAHIKFDDFASAPVISTKNLFYRNSDNYVNVFENSILEEFNFSSNKVGVFDVRIEKDPGVGYSCIGSFERLDDFSSFGDCDFMPENRLWVKFQADVDPPEVNVIFDYLANSARFSIDVKDSGSGVNWSSANYCLSDELGCDPIFSYKEGDSISTECIDSSTCVKYLSFIVSDNNGNVAEITRDIRLLEKGSSCQADCTSKPSPNRFLKECNNLNSCNYYDYDDNGVFDNGDYVANLCDLNILDTYVKYNDTHQIKCPNGPFRKLPEGSFLDISSRGGECLAVNSVKFPVFLNGLPSLLYISTCIN